MVEVENSGETSGAVHIRQVRTLIFVDSKNERGSRQVTFSSRNAEPQHVLNGVLGELDQHPGSVKAGAVTMEGVADYLGEAIKAKLAEASGLPVENVQMKTTSESP